MSPDTRHPELWRLRHVEKLSYGQIAKKTGLSRNTVQGRVYRMAPPPPPETISPTLRRLAAFDPLARRLLLESERP